ncbi:MAG: ribosomal RNA small subunit methyltransferase A [Thermoplasmata archaeon]|nr:ribosomal RNA small subunit methyltransferase A [Thermoplasmata archaeon]
MAKKGRAPLGQNFLADSYYASRMVSLVKVREGEKVVEVGPGEGSLTRWLVKRGVRLTAIEVDPRLAATIRERFAGKVELKVADVLDMDFCEPPLAGSTVVSNLPFYITSPFLYRMIETVKIEGKVLRSCWRGAYITLQREVVEKILPREEWRCFSRLGVHLNMRFEIEPLLEIPPDAFRPRPQVSSVFVRFTPRETLLADPGDHALFDSLLRRVYARRRRKMRNTLLGFRSLSKEGLERALGELSWTLQKRPEEVSLMVLAEISKRIYDHFEEQKIKYRI